MTGITRYTNEKLGKLFLTTALHKNGFEFHKDFEDCMAIMEQEKNTLQPSKKSSSSTDYAKNLTVTTGMFNDKEQRDKNMYYKLNLGVIEFSSRLTKLFGL